jgi:hypothetical protein
MFEILSQFIEEECSPGHIEWYGEHGHKLPSGKYVRDEMQDLYDWWHQVYLVEYPAVEAMLFEKAEKHGPVGSLWKPLEDRDLFEYDPDFETEEDGELYSVYMLAVSKLERICEADLNNKMRRMIDIRESMWT